MGIETRVGVKQFRKCGNHQASAGEKHQGNSELTHNENLTKPSTARCRAGTAGSFLEGLVDTGSAGFEGRGEAKQDSRSEGNEECEREDPDVEMDIRSARQIDRSESKQRAESKIGHQQAQGASRERDEHALREQLLEKPPARGSHGDADSNFAASQAAASEKQIRNICTSNQQHEPDGAEKDQQEWTNVSANHLLVRQETDPEFLADDSGEFAAKVLGDDVHLRLELHVGNAGFKARQHADVFSAAGGIGHEGKGSPDIRGTTSRKVGGDGDRRETSRHNTDQSVRVAIQKNFPADLSRVRPEAARPQIVANDGDALSASTIIFLSKIAAEKRLNAQDMEVRSGDGHASQMFRTVTGGKVIADRRITGDVFEGFFVILQPFQFTGIEVHFIGQLVGAFGKLHNAIRIGKRQRAQEDAVDDSEDSGVCPDTESQSQNGNESEGRRFCKHTQAKSDVLPEAGHGAPRRIPKLGETKPGTVAIQS